jgi:cytochrome P450
MTDFADRWGYSPDRFWLRGERPDEPVQFEEELGRWNVYGYPELVEILGDPDGYGVDATRLFELDENTRKYVDGDISQYTGLEHANARKQISRWFTPKALGDLETRIHKVADELLTDLADRKRFDILDDFVEDISSIVFSELLGTPVEEREMLKIKDEPMNYEVEMANGQDGDGGYFEGLVAPLAPLRDFIGKAVDACVERPKDDVLSLMAQFRKLDGTSLSRDEMINFGISILGAGRLATPMLVGSALMCLESFPEQAARVRADRSLVPSMLEETMRFLSPGNQSARATNLDVELGGKKIPKDQLVILWIGAANRDARAFTDPDFYDVTRNPNPHLGFGRGSYYCMGAHMVRMETRIMFNLLMDRFPNLRIDPDTPPVHFGSPEFTGPSAVTVLVD